MLGAEDTEPRRTEPGRELTVNQRRHHGHQDCDAQGPEPAQTQEGGGRSDDPADQPGAQVQEEPDFVPDLERRGGAGMAVGGALAGEANKHSLMIGRAWEGRMGAVSGQV